MTGHSAGPSFLSSTATQVVGGLVVAGILALFGVLVATQETGNGRDAGQTRSQAVNKTATVNNFVVTVISIECGAKKFEGFEPKGEFCVVLTKVTNRGTATSHVLPTLDWTLYVGDNTFTARAATGPGFEDLFPNTGADGKAAFDVPIGSEPSRLVLSRFGQSEVIPL